MGVAVDVCVGKNQLRGDKRAKIGNIGAVECRTCHRKLSKYVCAAKLGNGLWETFNICSQWNFCLENIKPMLYFN